MISKYLRRRKNQLITCLRNQAATKRALRDLQSPEFLLRDLTRYEKKYYSQNGEDGIIEIIFQAIGTTNKFYVEFGSGPNGLECNTRCLKEKLGWHGLMMDGAAAEEPTSEVKKEYVSAENIHSLFAKHNVPDAFDLLSIDIDGNDYWVWQAIVDYQPRAVVIEYNASVPPTESRTISYEPDFVWDGSDYFGASLLALQELGKEKGYTLVGGDSRGVNAFFVLDSLVAKHFSPPDITAIYRKPAYGHGRGHPHNPRRRMIEI